MAKTAISSQVYGKAFHLYLAGKTFPEIAKTFSIPQTAIKAYALKMGWKEHREALVKSGQETAVQTFRKMQEANLNEVASRHLDLTKRIDEHIDVALQKRRVGVRQLKDLSSTLVNTSDVAGRIVGLHRLTSQDAGKPLLVQFNLKVQTGETSSGTSSAPITMEAESREVSEKQDPDFVPDPF